MWVTGLVDQSPAPRGRTHGGGDSAGGGRTLLDVDGAPERRTRGVGRTRDEITQDPFYRPLRVRCSFPVKNFFLITVLLPRPPPPLSTSEEKV